MKRCLRCPAVIAKGSYCPTHELNYSTAEWERMVREVLARDGHQCTACGSRCPHANGGHGHHDVDHIQPRGSGGADHPSNLRTLCASANRGRGGCKGRAPQVLAFWNQPVPRRPLRLARRSSNVEIREVDDA